jgi:copper/silver efflux system protein
MINAIISASLRERILVLLGAVVLAVVGYMSYASTPLDAIPDLSDVQVIVMTEYPGQAPQVVEDQVTYPLTTALLAVPKTKVVRGYSFFGLSFVYMIFEDHVDMYWARARVLESLNFVSGRLPAGVAPRLGPDATGVGWIYEYALVDRSGQHDLSELRSLQDWYLRYPLQTVPGVAEVASVGGFVRQYQIEVDPNALLRYNISIETVKNAVQRSNNAVGGRLVEMAETEYMVRAEGYIKSIDDINSIALTANESGTPVLIKDVANVQLGPELRRGLTDLNGEGEVAGGVVIMRFGENALATIKAVREKLEDLKQGLPEGVEIVTVYDRGDLIERAAASLTTSLMEELLIVSLVVIVFLLHARSAFVAIITLPLGVLMAFIVMRLQGLNANIMSLGGIAIAIGTMVDGAIVMVENGHKHLAQASSDKGRALTRTEHWQTIEEACRQVGPALFFSLLVITVSFVPIFTLQSQEGRLFSPLAFTKTYSMAAAAILSITLVPVLMGYFLRGKMHAEDANPLNRIMRAMHRPVLAMLMKYRVATMVCALALLGATAYPYTQLGSEFMPPLDEGDILYMPTTFPGISITKAKEVLQQTDRILATFPEVLTVFGKIGRAATATDSAPLSMIETTIRLKPRDQWPDPDKTNRDLMREMDQAMQIPGLANTWTMPIKNRIDMLATGIKTPVGIKIAGPDLDTLQALAIRIEQVIKILPGTLSAFGDRSAGGYYLDIDVDREATGRYGLQVGQVQDVIMSAIGGMKVTETIEGIERYPVNIRYPRDLRSDREGLERVLIPTHSGAAVPLAMVADIRYTRGAPMIKSEDGRPNAWIYIDIESSDIGGYVRRAKEFIASEISLPTGYTISWSGQFEHMERAAARLKIVVPATLLVIFLLMYIHFRRIAEPLVVMLSIPFGLIGGIWLTYLNGYNVSVAVAVGFIALAGLAAEIGVLILSFIDQKLAEVRLGQAGNLSGDTIINTALAATSERVRPVVMTGLSTMAGLIPIALSTGTGSDVTQRIAAPMLGGMATVMVLNLLVLPVVYSLVLEWREGRRSEVSN